MKRILSLLVFIFSNVVLSSSIKYIPFDLGYQFGYSNLDGMIMWGKDWKSNNLLFDGTWAIFPPLYGLKIEEGFQNVSNIFEKKQRGLHRPSNICAVCFNTVVCEKTSSGDFLKTTFRILKKCDV